VHYNPASIRRAKEEIRRERAQKLGAVVVEACESRWNSSLKLARPGSLAAKLICSEMQGAAGTALQNDVPVMLGDVDVGPFVNRVRSLAWQTVREVFNPLSGGWRSIRRDYSRTLPSTFEPSDVANSSLLLPGEAPLGLRDFARADIAVGFLVALLRYPTAAALKAPVPFAIFVTLVWALDTFAGTIDTMTTAAVGAGESLVVPIAVVASLNAFNLLLFLLVSRLLLVAFLEERNAELARSIRRAAAETQAPVVAILGGLHVNGVARLLMSEEVPDADTRVTGRNKDGVWWKVPLDVDAARWA